MSKALFFIFFLVCFYDQSNAFHLGEESNNNFYSSYASRTPKRSAVTPPDIESSSNIPPKPWNNKFQSKLDNENLAFNRIALWYSFDNDDFSLFDNLLSKKPKSFDIDSPVPSEFRDECKNIHPQSCLLWYSVNMLDEQAVEILLKHGANPYKNLPIFILPLNILLN